MANGFGISFVPGAQDDPTRVNGNGRPGAPKNPVQEAIQVLSLRLPKVYGAQALAPAPLLTSPGGMGQPGAKGNVTAQALAQLGGVPMPAQASPVSAPVLSGGPYTDWMRQERSLSSSGSGSGPSFGNHGGGSTPSASAPPPAPPAPPRPPAIVPGEISGAPGSPVVTMPGPWIDPRPHLPAREQVQAPPPPAAPEEHLSPFQVAEREGRLQDLLDFTSRLYSGNAGGFAGVNLYDPSTWR